MLHTMSEIEITEKFIQTLAIPEEQESLLKEHIDYHKEMKDFLESSS